MLFFPHNLHFLFNGQQFFFVSLNSLFVVLSWPRLYFIIEFLNLQFAFCYLIAHFFQPSAELLGHQIAVLLNILEADVFGVYSTEYAIAVPLAVILGEEREKALSLLFDIDN